MTQIIDPRRGDVETDVSSTKSRSLLSLAGGLLAEISLPKLIVAWTLLLIVPGLLLGLAPIVASDWVRALSGSLAAATIGLWSLLVIGGVIAIGWFGWRTLFRLAESGFWSLNSVVVQPGYAATREILRQLAEKLFPSSALKDQFAKLRAGSAVAAGILICAVSFLVVYLVWPSTQFFGSLAEIGSWRELIVVALANSIVVIASYLAIAALFWGAANSLMAQPRDLLAFDTPPEQGRLWRVVHLSDIHVVGERYGFRIESGRVGPRGNERLKRLLDRLEAIHATAPLDVVLITGDMTDAGSSAEWAEFLDAMREHPALAARTLNSPRQSRSQHRRPGQSGTHGPADQPQSAFASIQGVVGHGGIARRPRAHGGCRARPLGKDAQRNAGAAVRGIRRFADTGRPMFARRLTELWAKVFPMVLPPDRDDGLGFVLLNSNADTHFSFTNALGMVSAEQVKGIDIARKQYPQACWIIALHHHAVEYPRPAKALSERIGTALINGNWFVRSLEPLAGRAVVMHGHRHVDWIGTCAGLRIVSAPSPVMEVTDEKPTYFYVHTLAVGAHARLRLLQPERIDLPGGSDNA